MTKDKPIGLPLAAAVLLSAQPNFATAQEGLISFENGWNEQTFFRLTANEFRPNGSELDVASYGAVSLLWREIDPDLRSAASASWNWTVEAGVVPTNLTQRGGDDRNLGLYFVFADPAEVASWKKISAKKLFRSAQTRTLIYVWGGNHEKGSIQPSPYSEQLATLILQTDRTGKFSEGVNLEEDFASAFGEQDKILVGVAVSADSDDTNGSIIARISDLRLK